MLLEKWTKLKSIGIRPGMEDSVQREIRMLNAMSIAAIFLNIVVSFSWIFVGAFRYAVINYFMAVALMGVIILNKSGNLNLAKGFFFITILVHIAIISVMFKFQSEYYLFPLIVIAGFIFRKTKQYMLFLGLTFIVYYFMTGDFADTGYVEYRREYSHLVNFVDGILAIGLTVIALNQYLGLAESNRREIVVKNKLLEEAVSMAKERAEYSELLLKEMNHRVKNNLQMISSLLNIHAERSRSKIARNALLDAKSRIYSIALVHRQLYVEYNFTQIDVATYIDELIPFVKESFPLLEDTLEIRSLCSHVSLEIEEAVSLGLILNELITNSVKHSAIIGEKLVVKVLVYYNEENMLFVSVENNGKKINEAEFFNSKNFGMDLVAALASSFDGKMSVEAEFNRVAMTLKIGNYFLSNNKENNNG